jgi:hypothetical protein
MADMELENESLRAQIAKTRTEIEHIPADRRVEWFKVIITAAGTAVVAIGLLYQSCAAHQQRRWDESLARHNARVKRMTEIATDYETLYHSTLSGLVLHETRVITLTLALEGVRDKIKDSQLPDVEKRVLLDRFETILHESPEKPALQEFKDIVSSVSVQSEWEVHEDVPAPDAEFYFGTDVRTKWKPLYAEGHETIISVFGTSQISSNDLEKTDAFQRAGAKFANYLRSGVQREINQPIAP